MFMIDHTGWSEHQRVVDQPRKPRKEIKLVPSVPITIIVHFTLLCILTENLSLRKNDRFGC